MEIGKRRGHTLPLPSGRRSQAAGSTCVKAQVRNTKPSLGRAKWSVEPSRAGGRVGWKSRVVKPEMHLFVEVCVLSKMGR